MVHRHGDQTPSHRRLRPSLPPISTHGGGNSNEVRDQLTGGVDHVVGTLCAFAAVKDDGSVVAWGHADFGGNSDKVKSEFQGIVFKVKANLPA